MSDTALLSGRRHVRKFSRIRRSNLSSAAGQELPPGHPIAKPRTTMRGHEIVTKTYNLWHRLAAGQYHLPGMAHCQDSRARNTRYEWRWRSAGAAGRAVARLATVSARGAMAPRAIFSFLFQKVLFYAMLISAVYHIIVCVKQPGGKREMLVPGSIYPLSRPLTTTSAMAG